jgi:hypothetical protein
MDAKKLKALLIGWSSGGCSSLSWRLKKLGCDCWFAFSNQEACWLLDNDSFNLVLSPIALNGNCMHPLIGQLDGSYVTLFYSEVMNNGCWWVPALWLGRNCHGVPALRHTEFVTALDETIKAIQFIMRVPADPQSPMAPSFSSSIMPPPLSQGVTLFHIGDQQESEPHSI